MKKIAVVIATIAVILLVAPYFVGKTVEAKYQTIIQQVQKNNQFTFKNSVFERSWFSAKAVNTLVIPLRANAAINVGFPKELTVKVSENINFGPMILSKLGLEFGFARSIATVDIQQYFINKALAAQINNNLHIQSFVSFTQDYITDINF